jgi:hypothetical protein
VAEVCIGECQQHRDFQSQQGAHDMGMRPAVEPARVDGETPLHVIGLDERLVM